MLYRAHSHRQIQTRTTDGLDFSRLPLKPSSDFPQSAEFAPVAGLIKNPNTAASSAARCAHKCRLISQIGQLLIDQRLHRILFRTNARWAYRLSGTHQCLCNRLGWFGKKKGGLRRVIEGPPFRVHRKNPDAPQNFPNRFSFLRAKRARVPFAELTFWQICQNPTAS